jgi:putative NIF3 family GTP cyclohydrolase 1 type 2
MKISIITMHNFPNYGSVLQAYATQEKLKKYGEGIEIIDYVSSRDSVSRRMGSYIMAGYMRNHLGHRPNPIMETIKIPFRVLKKIRFGSFIKEHLQLSENLYVTQDDLKSYPKHDGYYVTGSDQVWKLGYKDKMPFFFFFFPQEKKKVGYSVSVGNYNATTKSNSDFANIKSFVQMYSHISVRERIGIDLLKKYCDYSDVVQILDPTLALPGEFWRGFATNTRITGDYILVYKLGKDKEFEKFADKISRKTKLPLVRVCSNSIIHVFSGKGKKIILPPVTEFISLIEQASYVLTDSFHGVAFSFNLGTEPVVFRKDYDGGRITGLLKVFEEDKRYCTDFNNIDIIESRVNWNRIDEILTSERKKIDSFLESVFNE